MASPSSMQPARFPGAFMKKPTPQPDRASRVSRTLHSARGEERRGKVKGRVLGAPAKVPPRRGALAMLNGMDA